MIEKFQDFLRGPFGKVTAIVIVLVGVVAIYFSSRNSFGTSEAGRMSRDRTFICTETGKPFEYTVKLGDSLPVPSPFSGKNTGQPAEFCYWAKDGKVKQNPTPVLLNKYLNKTGPTFCPDCGRLVVDFNPPPVEGMSPPPTQAEYKPGRGVGVQGERNEVDN
jgi:hypothetical protein